MNFTRYIRDFSIQKKLLWLFMIVLSSVLLLAGALSLTTEFFSTRHLISEMLKVRASILSENLTASLVFDDIASAQEILNGLKVDSHIAGAWIYKKDGTLFTQYTQQANQPEPAPPFRLKNENYFGKNMFVASRTIISAKETVGVIFIKSDMEMLFVRLRSTELVGAVILFFSLGLGALISVSIQRMISKPIRELAELMQRASEENNYSLRMQWCYGRDELGQLAEAFNRLLGQIELQNDQLKNMNQILEKRVEERTRDIQSAEKFLDTIVENIPNMIFMKDVDGLRFVRFNRAGEILLGFKRGDLIGKNDCDFFPKEEADQFTAKDREVLRGRNIVDIPEEVIHTRYGEMRILHTKKVPIYNSKGEPEYLLGISEDITEKKQAQETLLKKTEMLARSRAELEQLELFAFAATHDLQEPLRKILFYADMLKTQNKEDLSGQNLMHLEKILNSAERMRLMMDQMRELSHIGSASESFSEVVLKDVVRNVLVDLDLQIKEMGASIEIKALPVISASPTQMQQLFQNLISNALKYHRAEVAPHVVIQGRSLDVDYWEITVADNGIGFDEKYVDRIFKPFQRLHTRHEYEGSGIGLTICQKIVLKHGGKITAHSQVGVGSTFVMTLPVDFSKGMI